MYTETYVYTCIYLTNDMCQCLDCIYIYVWLFVCYLCIQDAPPEKQSQGQAYHILGASFKRKKIDDASPFQIPNHSIPFTKKVFKQNNTDTITFHESHSKSASTQKCVGFIPTNPPTSFTHPPVSKRRGPSGRYQCVGLDHATRHRNQHDPGSFGWVAFDGRPKVASLAI